MGDRTILVIGGGPAGVGAALESAALGGQVTLVHAEPLGGRATWHSLVPSKVYLAAADRLDEARHQHVLGLNGGLPTPSLPAMRERIGREAQAWAQHQERQLAAAGVTVIAGKATLAAPNRALVTPDGAAEMMSLAFDRAIIATGSLPVFLPQIKPDGRRILAPRLAGKLAEWPDHLIMIGGGVTGAEFVYFFAQMGCRVTWVTDQPTILPRTDADLASGLEQSLIGRGVVIHTQAPVVAATADGSGVRVTLQDSRCLEGSHAFIAIGRRADVADLGLAAAGIAAGDAGIHVDAFCRTSCPLIYAVGDAAGPPYVANRALAQARVAARHALDASPRPFRPDTIVEATYTSPQLATVGLSEAAALAAGLSISTRRIGFAEALKPHLIGAPGGLLKLVTAKDDGRILGGGAFGDHAAEVLTPVALAIANGLGVEHLADVVPAYPSMSDIPFAAARGYAC